MKENQYVVVVYVLFRRNFDGMLFRCIDSTKAQKVLEEFHEGICGGHVSPTTTTHKIMKDGYYWRTIFKDSCSKIRKCVSYQKNSRNMKKAAMSRQPIIIYKPFIQWGLDVIGQINPKSRKGHYYILTTTDYFTKWSEAISLKILILKNLSISPKTTFCQGSKSHRNS
jgi:hypothetical protein